MRCLACNAVIHGDPPYYRGKAPVCSQACAATKEVHPAHRPITHTMGPFAASRGNIADRSFYIAGGRIDHKSGMTFFDEHVAWVQERGDADLLALAPSAPHTCTDPACPGMVNKRKLEAFEEIKALVDNADNAPLGRQIALLRDVCDVIARAEGKE